MTCYAIGGMCWTTPLAHVEAVSCLGAIHIPERIDENGNAIYTCTADDAAYATFQLAGGVVAHINSSWTVRVRRDDLLDFAGGWHQRLCGGRTSRMLESVVHEYAQARLESRHSATYTVF